MEPLTFIGILILGILLLSFHKVLSVVVKVAFYGLLVVLFMVLFFDISLNQVMDWVFSVLLWAV